MQRWGNTLHAGVVQEANLNTTQGNLGMKGHPSDHSNSGCAVIAKLIVSACLAGLATTAIFEIIIDVICQQPLNRIRAEHYPNQGFVHVSSEEALEDLVNIGLLERPDASTPLSPICILKKLKKILMSFQEGGPSGLKCDRFAGDLFEDTHLIRSFASNFMSNDCERKAACVYFHSHFFALIQVNNKSTRRRVLCYFVCPI